MLLLVVYLANGAYTALWYFSSCLHSFKSVLPSCAFEIDISIIVTANGSSTKTVSSIEINEQKGQAKP